MVEQFFAPENLPFSVALTIMVILGFLEGLGLVVGLAFSELLDSLLPDHDVGLDAHVEGDVPHFSGGSGVEFGHADHVGPFTRMLSWLRVGRVPILILLVIFLLSFGLGGLVLQALVSAAVGTHLPALVAVPVALVFGVGSMNVLGGLAEKIIPRDESSAVSQESFVGRIAVITTGTARRGKPAEARLRDQYQQAHYVMLEPDIEGEELTQGQEVLVVRRVGATFRAISNPSASLTHDPNE